MGQAIDRHRFEARIAEDHFVEVPHRRVAVERRLHVERQRLPQLGKLFEKLDRFGLPEGFEILLVVAHFAGAGVVPQGPADLLRQLVVQPVDQLADVVGRRCPGASPSRRRKPG